MSRPRIADWLRSLADGTSGSRALEIGAGEGRLAEILVERFDLVYAVDVDPGSVDAPASRSRRLCMDATRLGFADRSFDLVAAYNALVHLPAPDRILSGSLRRLLTSHGLTDLEMREDRPGRYALRGFLRARRSRLRAETVPLVRGDPA